MKNTSYLINRAVIISEVFDKEVIIMNLSDGIYYTLSGIAAEIWDLMEARYTAGAMAEYVSKRYDLDHTSSSDEVANFISDLLAEEIILEDPDTAASVGIVAPKDFGPYLKPELTRHTDMAEIMAMDPPLPELSAAGNRAL